MHMRTRRWEQLLQRGITFRFTLVEMISYCVPLLLLLTEAVDTELMELPAAEDTELMELPAVLPVFSR